MKNASFYLFDSSGDNQSLSVPRDEKESSRFKRFHVFTWPCTYVTIHNSIHPWISLSRVYDFRVDGNFRECIPREYGGSAALSKKILG